MKQFKLLIIVLLTVLVSSCGSQKNTQNNSKNNSKTVYQFKKDSTKTYFNILQLNDVYEIAPIQSGKFGGMARVETVHQNLKNENKNTMLVLAGDFLNPSLIGAMKVDGARVRGQQMVEVMNAMNFDLVAFGNHELDLSYTNLQERLNESHFDWISSNVLHHKNGKHHYFHKVINGKKESLEDSYIREFLNPDGSTLKVGFISACIASNPKSYVYYGDVYQEIKRAYNEIKNKVDVVIGLTHLNLEQDKKVAELLPNLPLIMGGHEHTNSHDEIGNVVIAKADANAKTVYIHRFEYDPTTKKIQLKSELKEINHKIPTDQKIGVIVDKWQMILKNKIQDIVSNPYEVIYKTKIPLDARETPIRSTQTNMGEIIAKSMSFAYNNTVDCALVNGGSVRIDDALVGKISVIDIFRVLPYGGQILKVKIKGKLLKEVLEFGENSAGTGAYLQRYNAIKIGDTWKIKNQQINNNKIYTVAFSDYLLKGYDIPMLSEKNPDVLSIHTPKSSEVSYDIRKAVIQYLKKQ
ncbi:bifunctional metallophosphatase/5'-nucleotidase [Tenacibaculum piscium]|uniref:bifunctional metallophosphatase/5'-nucleotidase n=1 Tax=Tenacibaculum piscium TaxID=1458515 RepID=UPI001EFAD1BF|nr:bifunctional metallophosphatase/5'-nucleotidase [Tenacibaculum piscium]MCG8182364.1 bifunctional metallophosphatase/5'-nucleotidase [Tenacibaculum piscium]MCG8203756.1 bifunctional metallophosphatase/5'-nucleotidase [Tenacibaculum piscium]